MWQVGAWSRESLTNGDGGLGTQAALPIETNKTYVFLCSLFTGDGRSGPGLDRKYHDILLQNNNWKGET